MKTKLLFAALIFPFYILTAQNTYVPDDNFEAYLESIGKGDGIPNNDLVLTANIATITNLSLASSGISDFTGIEDFSALQTFICNDNGLTSLDVSNNTSLTSLRCTFNSLTSLDVSNNTALTYLDCQANLLEDLDVSSNTLLTYLGFANNLLTTIDLSQNSDLEYLLCSWNSLSALDVSQNLSLLEISCHNNNLTSLDIVANTNLNRLFARTNEISNLNFNSNLEFLDIRTNQLTGLDVSQNSAMYYMRCENNLLENLNVKNGNNINFSLFSANNNPSLTCVNVDDVSWSDANWSSGIDGGVVFSTDCASLSVDENDLNEIKMYPVPMNDVLNVEATANYDYVLYNLAGQVISEGKLYPGNNQIQVKNVAKGVLMLNIFNDSSSVVKKIIKQ